MDRRAALAALGAAALAPAAIAQGSARVKRVAMLWHYLHEPTPASRKAEYAKAFEALGFRQGENLDLRWYEMPLRDRAQLFDRQVALLAETRPDCIIVGDERFIAPVSAAIPGTPIVARIEGDPVRKGIAASLQRPGGNVTGLHDGQREVNGKRVEILKTFVPGLQCVAWIAFGGQLGWYPYFEEAAREGGLRVRKVIIEGSDAPSLEKLRRELSRLRADGCPAGHFHSAIPEAIAAVTEVARERKLALSYSGDYQPWETEGLLFLYSARTRALGQGIHEREVAIVARILRGERPGDIPFEGPTGYYLLVNGKTAASIGLSIPPVVSIMAEKVLQ